MTISGFTMVRNATKLCYPIGESIASLLPLVDEFVVALGDCDEDDQTREAIEKVDDGKIRIIDTVWDLEAFPRGTEHAHQTDIAKEACKGDWLFYLQADEVVHEKDLDVIREKCEKHLYDGRVEGFLFQYFHFWGDFSHYQKAHGWYPREIRIIRNDPDIHSWRSAQSFRRIPGFDGKSYRQVKGTYKLNVIPLNAHIYHYGWVRPPRLMNRKKKTLASIHKEKGDVEKTYFEDQAPFDYGRLDLLPRFRGSHPAVMKEWIERSDWKEEPPTRKKGRPPHKHEKWKNRVLTFLEQNLFGGEQLFTGSNWNLIKDE